MISRGAILFLLTAVLECGFGPAFCAKADATAPPVAAAAATNRVLDEAVVTKLLTAVLQAQFTGGDGTLDVKLTRPWVAREIPAAGPLTLKILEMPNGGVASSFLVRFEIFAANGSSLGNWPEPVRAHLWRQIRVARSMLKPGERVADADIALERRDMLALHGPLAEFADGDPSLEIAQSVPAGSPLLAGSVKLRPVVYRSQMITARLDDGALTVTMKVEAMETGTPGQIIRLRNLQSNRDLSGKVLDDKTVLVTL